jgi:hypothetical protein
VFPARPPGVTVEFVTVLPFPFEVEEASLQGSSKVAEEARLLEFEEEAARRGEVSECD